MARANESQLAPYSEGNIDLTDKKAVENADRERFDFVNKIVSKVETRKVLTKDKNSDDRIDAVLTNPVAGILIFAGIMFLVFQISQAWVGPLIADTLVAWLETFQAWVGTLLENANPLLSALLVDGVIGGVSARYRLPAAGHGHVLPDRPAGGLRLHVPCRRGAGPHLQEGGSVRQVRHSLCHHHRLRCPRHHGPAVPSATTGSAGPPPCSPPSCPAAQRSP